MFMRLLSGPLSGMFRDTFRCQLTEVSKWSDQPTGEDDDEHPEYRGLPVPHGFVLLANRGRWLLRRTVNGR